MKNIRNNNIQFCIANWNKGGDLVVVRAFYKQKQVMKEK